MPKENISLFLFRDLCFLRKREGEGKGREDVEERGGRERGKGGGKRGKEEGKEAGKEEGRKEGITWQAPT